MAIKSEISSYKDIVLALDREIQGNTQEIVWDYFMHEDRIVSPHSVIVGKVSDEIKQMGFMQMYIYDKEHLKNSMYPEDSWIAHAHDVPTDVLLRLPQMLNSPVAIVTERSDKVRDSSEEEYKCLHFLFSERDDGKQKYYRAVINPQTHYNGLLISGFASKVITFYEIDERKFDAILGGAVSGTRQLLYFNADRYQSVESQTKPIELCSQASMALPVRGHFTQDPNLRIVSDRHKVALNSAVTAELNKLILCRSTRGEDFPLFRSALKTLEYGDSFSKIRSAYSTAQKVIMLSQDRVLRLRSKEHIDRVFARSYTRLMTQDEQKRLIDAAVKRIDSMSVDSTSDLSRMCDEIDRVMKMVPTLDNLGAKFSDLTAGSQSVIDARAVSGKLQMALEQRLADILREKSIGIDIDRSRNDFGPILGDE